MSWYLRTRYEDPRRGEVRERHYHDDGAVWVVIDGERSLFARLDAEQLALAKAAVAAAGLAELADIPAVEGDLAVMRYEWALGGARGAWVDAAYPQQLPQVVQDLEEALLDLEQQAGD